MQVFIMLIMHHSIVKNAHQDMKVDVSDNTITIH